MGIASDLAGSYANDSATCEYCGARIRPGSVYCREGCDPKALAWIEAEQRRKDAEARAWADLRHRDTKTRREEF